MKIVDFVKNMVGIYIVSAVLFACNDSEESDLGFLTTKSKVSEMNLNQIAYWPGEEVICSFELLNETLYPMNIREVRVRIENLSDNGELLSEQAVASDVVIESGKSARVDAGKIYTVPGTLKPSSFCRVKIILGLEGDVITTLDGGYFRAINSESLITYEIEKSDYHGLPVYRQIGDMSSGYGVLKSLTAFGRGISATMEEAPQGGTYPVAPTPEFLQRSLQKTVDLYNAEIGVNTKIKRVVIGTGVASVSYFSTMMDAVYLPIHFLVSANSTAEIQSILDYSNDKGYSTYATLGYDGSMPGVGVAWIKLLDLPEEYKKFILDHQVEEVYVYGVSQEGIGESYARKILGENSSEEAYAPGSVYILYTNFGSAADIDALSNRLYDYHALRLDEAEYISDWESGIIDEQVDNFSLSVRSNTSADIYTVTTADMMALYNISSYLTVKYIQKNEDRLQSPYLKGISFNEYLTNHPHYEAYTGHVPLLYWQFNPAASTVQRIDTDIKPAISMCYPALAEAVYGWEYYLNSNLRRFELRDELVKRNVSASKIKIRESADKWNPDDQLVGSAEDFARDIVERIGVETYRNNIGQMKSLTLEELREICGMIKGMDFIEH